MHDTQIVAFVGDSQPGTVPREQPHKIFVCGLQPNIQSLQIEHDVKALEDQQRDRYGSDGTDHSSKLSTGTFDGAKSPILNRASNEVVLTAIPLTIHVATVEVRRP